jgi:hypothetical protein
VFTVSNSRHVEVWQTYLGLLLQVECVDLFKFTFLIDQLRGLSHKAIMKHTTRKKNVALFACSEVCGSSDSTPWLLSPSGGIIGVALSFLISYKRSAADQM